jgi:hypothetical protein
MYHYNLSLTLIEIIVCCKKWRDVFEFHYTVKANSSTNFSFVLQSMKNFTQVSDGYVHMQNNATVPKSSVINKKEASGHQPNGKFQ